MTAGPYENQKDIDQQIQRIYLKLDKFEERIDHLEGQMIIVTKWLERIEHRLGRMEDVRYDVLQVLNKLQTELETKAEKTEKDKDIILQLLSNENRDKEAHAQFMEVEKDRKQERFLQVWAVLGPVIASVLSSFFTRFFM
ncbi:hypothetical protein BP422_20870 [Brevibacillus formosus]|uniref:Uncharacterized protein n=1 Tax=Brevibacillus formosus TaxID=54913 RepID=A0A220MML1_9BACL|nr:hypothetical protein [Brevibacillus formosus]ASJ55790.1 hypothetical protein BP422_20870 [Brevibacillus formosus]